MCCFSCKISTSSSRLASCSTPVENLLLLPIFSTTKTKPWSCISQTWLASCAHPWASPSWPQEWDGLIGPACPMAIPGSGSGVVSRSQLLTTDTEIGRCNSPGKTGLLYPKGERMLGRHRDQMATVFPWVVVVKGLLLESLAPQPQSWRHPCPPCRHSTEGHRLWASSPRGQPKLQRQLAGLQGPQQVTLGPPLSSRP